MLSRQSGQPLGLSSSISKDEFHAYAGYSSAISLPHRPSEFTYLQVKIMEDFKELLHIRFAEKVMGWNEIELSREDDKLSFYGIISTGKGPQRKEVPDYSNDLNAMWAAEQYLKSLGLTAAYINELAEITGAIVLTDREDLFRLINASPAQRCEAGLRAYEVGIYNG